MLVWEHKLRIVLFAAGLALVANATIIMSDASLQGSGAITSFPQGNITAESLPADNTNSVLAPSPTT